MDDRVGRESVDIALALLADRGFDATSMAQIAEATGIPADELEAALGTKDAIVLGVARDMLVVVANALAEIDTQTPIVEALMAAHSEVVADILAGTGPVSEERMRHMSKAIISSTELQKKVGAQRVEMLTGVLADRYRADPSDTRVQHGLKLWSAVLAATYLDVLDKHGHFDPAVDHEAPEYMRNRLNRAFRIVTGRSTRAT